MRVRSVDMYCTRAVKEHQWKKRGTPWKDSRHVPAALEFGISILTHISMTGNGASLMPVIIL